MAHLPAFVINEKVKRSNTCKQTTFRACDWLLFLFTIITLRSLMMKLRRICVHFMIILLFFENRGPDYCQRMFICCSEPGAVGSGRDEEGPD